MQMMIFKKIIQLNIRAIIIIGSIFLIAINLSCKKWLDKKPNDKLKTPEKLSDLQALLDATGYMNEEKTSAFLEASGDDFFLSQNDYNTQSPPDKTVYVWSVTATNFHQTKNDWASGYIPIYHANLCLDIIKTISVTRENTSQWNNVKGSALFFRSYYFLNLVWTFAKAYDENSADTDYGIALRVSSNYNEPSVRSTVRAAYNRVINDTKESLLYLPNVSLHPTRPSRAGAYGLLARAYLSMREYDSALKYSNLSLALKSDLMDFSGDNDIVSSISGIASPFRRFNKETVFYTEMNGTFDAHSLATIDSVLYSSYDVNDLRKQAFFTPSGNYQIFKGNYTQTAGPILFTGITTSEMFLVRAECYARKGEKEFSLSDLNMLLSKRWKTGYFTPIVLSNIQDILSLIITERRKELIMRGLRWIDVKRLNKEGADINIKRFVNGQFYTLRADNIGYVMPLPQYIIDITGMPQNP